MAASAESAQHCALIIGQSQPDKGHGARAQTGLYNAIHHQIGESNQRHDIQVVVTRTETSSTRQIKCKLNA